MIPLLQPRAAHIESRSLPAQEWRALIHGGIVPLLYQLISGRKPRRARADYPYAHIASLLLI